MYVQIYNVESGVHGRDLSLLGFYAMWTGK